MNIYLNDEDIRYLAKERTAVKETGTVSIISLIGGGVDVDMEDVKTAAELSNEKVLRYGRHLIIPEVGVEGQKKLKAARVLMIGAGGLGSPLGMCLAAAGVGSLGIVDFDVLDRINPQRQIMHSTIDVGRSKLDSARETLEAMNPNLNIKTLELRVRPREKEGDCLTGLHVFVTQ